MYITHIHIYTSMHTVICIYVHTHPHTLHTYTYLSTYVYYTHFHFFKRLEARALSGCCDPAIGLGVLLQKSCTEPHLGPQRGPRMLSVLQISGSPCFHMGLKASLFHAWQNFTRLNLEAEFLE